MSNYSFKCEKYLHNEICGCRPSKININSCSYSILTVIQSLLACLNIHCYTICAHALQMKQKEKHFLCSLSGHFKHLIKHYFMLFTLRINMILAACWPIHHRGFTVCVYVRSFYPIERIPASNKLFSDT